MRYNVEWTCYGIIFPVNTLLTLTLVVSISTLKELLPNDCYMMNSGRGALFCTHYINDMGTQDRSTAGLGKSIKYSAGSSALRRPCWSFREAVACLPVMSSLIKVWSGGCGEQVYVRGRVCVCVRLYVCAWWPWLEGSTCAKCCHAAPVGTPAGYGCRRVRRLLKWALHKCLCRTDFRWFSGTSSITFSHGLKVG